jgi:membrane protease YdiL (CAAX protease family)
MRERIVAISAREEFLVVVGLTYGVQFVVFATHRALYGFQPSIQFTDARVLRLVFLELSTAALLGYFLFLRGWRTRDLHLQRTWQLTVAGVALWLASYVLYTCTYLVAAWAGGPLKAVKSISFHGQVSVMAAVLVCLVNPFFEEALGLAYVLRVLERRGPLVAIGVSAGLRALAHAYQGPIAIAGILPMGLLISAYYWRYRQLWPPVVAHVILDAFAMLSLQP